jgi:hypothetical protein
MIVTLELDLLEELASEAASSGLLESRTISNLLIEEIRRRKSAAELKSILTGIRNQPGDIPTEDEINAEVEQARTLRRTGENGLVEVQRMLLESCCRAPSVAFDILFKRA